jgi:ADP-ribosyl-[dinitrogen reductase] hydrolase
LDEIIYKKSLNDDSFFIQKMTTLYTNLIRKKDETNSYTEMYYSLGSVLGAFLGDALGSYYEFQHGDKDMYKEKVVFNELNPVWGTSPGQITDDSELALSLGYGIIDSISKIPSFNKVAYYYGYWLFSSPFDIGNTTRNAMATVKNPDTYKDLPKEFQPKSRIIKSENYFYFNDIYLNGFKNTSKNKNMESCSNGFIMRKTPLATFCMNYVKTTLIDSMNMDHISDFESLKKACIDDTSLTHSNPHTHIASIIYTLIITRIIYLRTYFPNYKEVGKNTLDYIKDYINREFKEKTDDLEEILQLIVNKKPKSIKFSAQQYSKSMCWYLYGLLYSIKALLEIDSKGEDFYYSTIKDVINLGGDTDTNAAIVGGVIGAYWGPEKLEFTKLNTLITFNPFKSKSRHPRPCIYSPGFVMFVVERIFFNKQNKPEEGKNYFEDGTDLDGFDNLPITVSRLLQYFAN